MNCNVKSRPKIPRNKYGYLAGNSTGTRSNTASNNNSVQEGDKSLDTHLLWGNEFNGTQDVNGDISSPNIKNEGKITTDEFVASDSSTETLEVSGDSTLHDTIPQVDNESDLGKSDKRWKGVYSQNIDNKDLITTKNLNVTGKATFFELVIDKIRSAGGAALFTPADGFKADIVEGLNETGLPLQPTETTPYRYRLYWRATDADGNSRDNMWKVNDQALCMSFNQSKEGSSHNTENKYYWAKVIRVSRTSMPILKNGYTYHYIDILNDDYDGTLNPAAGDEIAQCGYRGTDDPERQSAIYISAYESLDSGLTAPLLAQYRGINDYDLASHRSSYFDVNGAKFVGNFEVSAGKSIETYISEQIAQSSLPLHNYTRYTKVQPAEGVTLYTQDSDEMKFVGIAVTTDTSAPTSWASYAWLPKGATGEDGLYIDISPSIIKFEGNSDGTVTINNTTNKIPVTIKAWKGDVQVSPSNITIDDFAGYNIAAIRRGRDTDNNPTLLITGVATETLSNGDVVSMQNGYIDATLTIEGKEYHIYVPFMVNFTTYMGEMSVTEKTFRTEFTEYKNGVASQLSTIEQNAENITLRVDDLEDDLIATGIDIENEKIKVTANNFEIDNNSGNKTMGVDASGNLVAYGVNGTGENRQVIISPTDQAIKIKQCNSRQEGTDEEGNVFTLKNPGSDGAIMKLYSNAGECAITGDTLSIGGSSVNVILDGEDGSVTANNTKTGSLEATGNTSLKGTIILPNVPVVNGRWTDDGEWIVNKNDSSYTNLANGQVYKFHDARTGGYVLMIK